MYNTTDASSGEFWEEKKVQQQSASKTAPPACSKCEQSSDALLQSKQEQIKVLLFDAAERVRQVVLRFKQTSHLPIQSVCIKTQFQTGKSKTQRTPTTWKWALSLRLAT